MEYNWYHKHLKQKLRELKKLQAIYDSIEIRQAINAITDEISFPLKRPKRTEPEIFYYEYQKFKDIRFLWDEFNYFSQNNIAEINYNPSDLAIKLSNNELVELSHDFFKNATTKKMYEQFLHFFAKRNKHLHFLRNSEVDFYADVFYLPYYQDLFLQLKPKDEFGDVATLNHEYGHGIQFLSNYHENIYQSNIMS